MVAPEERAPVDARRREASTSIFASARSSAESSGVSASPSRPRSPPRSDGLSSRYTCSAKFCWSTVRLKSMTAASTRCWYAMSETSWRTCAADQKWVVAAVRSISSRCVSESAGFATSRRNDWKTSSRCARAVFGTFFPST